MPGPDATAKTALGASPLRLCKVAYMDFNGDPVRITDAPVPLSFSGTGDPVLDGFTFDNLDHSLIELSASEKSETGTGPLEASLSGLVGIDTDIMNIIGNVTNWKGREAAFYFCILNDSLTRIGNIWPFHYGRMVNAYFSGSPQNVKITVVIEDYLASLFEASGRTYLDQSEFDAGDLSAGVIAGSINTNSPLTGGGWGNQGGVGGAGLGGYGQGLTENFYNARNL